MPDYVRFVGLHAAGVLLCLLLRARTSARNADGKQTVEQPPQLGMLGDPEGDGPGPHG
jgi:hypothetical protein